MMDRRWRFADVFSVVFEWPSKLGETRDIE
jgi:hypothetical protein